MADQTTVIIDTSVLVNFLAIDRIDLLVAVPSRRYIVTDHVRSEITAHFDEQLQRLHSAIASGQLVEITVTDLAEVETFARLSTTGLGVGECSAIAVAVHRQYAIAIDDRTAQKRIAKASPGTPILTTQLLVVEAILAGVVTVEEADALKALWQAEHRFTLPFASFSDFLRG